MSQWHGNLSNHASVHCAFKIFFNENKLNNVEVCQPVSYLLASLCNMTLWSLIAFFVKLSQGCFPLLQHAIKDKVDNKKFQIIKQSDDSVETNPQHERSLPCYTISGGTQRSNHRARRNFNVGSLKLTSVLCSGTDYQVTCKIQSPTAP